jgi:hypothetical protein
MSRKYRDSVESPGDSGAFDPGGGSELERRAAGGGPLSKRRSIPNWSGESDVDANAAEYRTEVSSSGSSAAKGGSEAEL